MMKTVLLDMQKAKAMEECRVLRRVTVVRRQGLNVGEYDGFLLSIMVEISNGFKDDMELLGIA